jgi:hypothetical protein
MLFHSPSQALDIFESKTAPACALCLSSLSRDVIFGFNFNHLVTTHAGGR